MSAPAPQSVTIQCPSCQTSYPTPVFTLVDVGVQPELKNYYLSGRLNVAVCPSCGTGGMLSTPLVYHDPARQLFLVLIPQELNLKAEEAERFVGEVTRVVMAALPADVPKGYLLTPRRFISAQTMLDTVLEAEGISKETLVAQRKRVELIGQLAEAFEQDRQADAGQPAGALEGLVAEHGAAIDYDLFMVLTALLEAAAQEGQTGSVELLGGLRARLLELSGFDAVEAGLADPSPEQVIERLRTAAAPQLQETIAELRPLLDDALFEQWADMAGDPADQERRAEVARLVDQMDAQAQQMFEGAATVLGEVMEADDLRAALRERHAQIDEAFMLVIEANLAAASRMGNSAAVDRLRELQRAALEVVQEMMSPEERLINQLVTAPTAAEATKVLRSNMRDVTPDLVKRLNELAEQMEQGGRKEIGERLRQMAREGSSLLF